MTSFLICAYIIGKAVWLAARAIVMLLVFCVLAGLALASPLILAAYSFLTRRTEK